MVAISELPRNPEQALEYVLGAMITTFSAGDVTVQAIKDAKHPLYLELLTNIAIARKCAERLQDEKIKAIALEYFSFRSNQKLSNLATQFSQLLEAVVSLRLDDHFFEVEDVKAYDIALLSKDEKAEIRSLMAKARKLTADSQELNSEHKRRINHRIAQVENELYKDRSMFSTFMAAAYEVSTLVRQVGDDARPIAEAIEKARTITEKKVTGYQGIETDPKPKGLPKPDSTLE